MEADIEVENDKSDTQTPTYGEDENSIQKLKNNIVPGRDKIAAELINDGRKAAIDAVHKLITVVWETEKMPNDWGTGIICPIYKKGDKLDCSSYRGITLLSIVYKFLSHIINERLRTEAEKIIGEYHCGFRPNKSTINQLFIIRQMMEKHYEHRSDLHVLFIDYKQDFDDVNRAKLTEILHEFGIPEKLIQLGQMTMNNTKAQV